MLSQQQRLGVPKGWSLALYGPPAQVVTIHGSDTPGPCLFTEVRALPANSTWLRPGWVQLCDAGSTTGVQFSGTYLAGARSLLASYWLHSREIFSLDQAVLFQKNVLSPRGLFPDKWFN
ncbi:hypothetical protein VFPPC_15171 [Pochonia chlamydosporia 170]|uniref:Uncharacterized protein n=1 Tax=Pochonia chlamydosporia 170 TaxID=1380566 RepID=A0A179G450_METCM|nr:hypothetical protein VFPPC_15171 [Pochonia chlamydosporia 170]OAQ72636.1 hypothetical protein VFPPC_15171 [Pochonia chlamydosporia 170]